MLKTAILLQMLIANKIFTINKMAIIKGYDKSNEKY